MDEKKIKEQLKSQEGLVQYAICDVDGLLRAKMVPADKLLTNDGQAIGYCNVVFGWDIADVVYAPAYLRDQSFADSPASIDWSTYRTLPWLDNQAMLLADFHQAPAPFSDICPRSLLRRVIAKAEDMGFNAHFALEFEWFNYQETDLSAAAKNYQQLTPMTSGMFGYSPLRIGQKQAFHQRLTTQLAAANIPLSGYHTETGPGVMEAALKATTPLQAADQAVLFKLATKQIAAQQGILASFMAKPSVDLPGCSGHIHQSLRRKSDGQALFADWDGSAQLPPMLEHYLAGLLHVLPHCFPLLAPTVNSYKRLVPGSWAPTGWSWGIENRTTAFRLIPSGKNSRIECRVTGSDINPYLAIAANLAAGLYGIEHQLKLTQPPISGDAYQATDLPVLPEHLGAATTQMLDSDLAKRVLGTTFINHFGGSRQWEWQQYLHAVSDWEQRRYLEAV